MSKAGYEHGLYAWSKESAALLRSRRFGELDGGHMVDEVEGMVARERRRRGPIALIDLWRNDGSRCDAVQMNPWAAFCD
jgi:hypothetical protein